MTVNNFKVIIVGGGPVGLTAAHALHLAGIDFILLERQAEIAIDIGATLVLGAGTLRIMHQFGLLDRLNVIGTELVHRKIMTLEGHVLNNSPFFLDTRKNHGTAPVAFHRADFVEALYEGLPKTSRQKILTKKDVLNIISDDNGVKAFCSDGTTYEGSIVIGADGVHSKTRSLMRKLALKFNPKREWDQEDLFITTYRTVWCSFPSPSKPGSLFETHHLDHSIMHFSGQDRSWVFLCQKLPEPTKKPSFYDEKDIEACFETFAEFPISEEWKVRDVYAHKTTYGVTGLEEGLANHWSCGRMVLAGDACHKFTPNAGLGLGNGIQDVVYLCNGLHKAVTTASGGIPSTAKITKLFQSYQNDRIDAVKKDAMVSAFMIRMHGWASTFYYIMSRYILRWSFSEYILLNYIIPFGDKKALVLDYVAAEEPFVGSVEWDHKMPRPLR